MDASGRRSGGGGIGHPRSRRAGVLNAKAWLAALLFAALPVAAAAQPKPPAAKPATKPAPAPPGPPPPSADGAPPQPPFRAQQRRLHPPGFGVANKRANDSGDPKSMTLIGELYANGLGVPQ